MEDFFQAAAAVLVTVVLGLTLDSQSKSFKSLLTMAVCAMVLHLGMRYMKPVADFLKELERLGNLSEAMVTILMKTALIGVLTEIVVLLCTDGGNSSLGQTLRIVGTAVILLLSLPLFRSLLDLVQHILEGV